MKDPSRYLFMSGHLSGYSLDIQTHHDDCMHVCSQACMHVYVCIYACIQKCCNLEATVQCDSKQHPDIILVVFGHSDTYQMSGYPSQWSLNIETLAWMIIGCSDCSLHVRHVDIHPDVYIICGQCLDACLMPDAHTVSGYSLNIQNPIKAF